MSSERKTGARGLALVKEFEGLSLDMYDCPADKATIGYGHLVRPGEQFDCPITLEQAEALLKADMADAERAVNHYVKVALNQNQFDALASFVFNLGSGNFQNSTLLKQLNRGLYGEAAEQLLRWNQAGGKVLAGLSRRREAERTLFLS